MSSPFLSSSASAAASTTPQPQPVSTSSVLLETSAGALVIDLFGCDCPALSGNYINLCRAKLWTGAVATEVVPDVAMFFSHAADAVYDAELMRSHSQSRPEATAAPAMANSFWHLVGLEDGATPLPGPHLPSPRQLAQAAKEEFTVCKRRVSESIRGNSASTVYKGGAGGAGSLGRRGLLIVEASATPPTPTSTTASAANVTSCSSQFYRFGLTLSDRAMDFMDSQYVAIGAVREGFGVLEAMRRAPYSTTAAAGREEASPTEGSRTPAPSLYIAGTPRWPRPLRILRVKHVTVLPTPGAEPFVVRHHPKQQRTQQPSSRSSPPTALTQTQERKQRLADALSKAGCFAYWAPHAAVAAASRHILAAVRRAQTVYSAEAAQSNACGEDGEGPRVVDLQPLVQVPSVAAMASTNGQTRTVARSDEDEIVSIEYNPHCTAGYLSSDEETSGNDQHPYASSANAEGGAWRRKELEARREAAKQLHQTKADETLSLMLNILNGVADVSGELKPPDNVLFVCKLNPATTGEGLATCFRQFGQILSAEVVTDRKTGNSLCYGFVEFASVDACYRAFQKMDRALIDDCRIHVDFSQSVSKLWFAKKRGMRKRERD